MLIKFELFMNNVFCFFLKLLWEYFHYKATPVCSDRRKINHNIGRKHDVLAIITSTCFISYFSYLATMDDQTISTFHFLCSLVSKKTEYVGEVAWEFSYIWKYTDQNHKLYILGAALYKLVWELMEWLVSRSLPIYLLPL